MNEFLGHNFADGKCIFCGAAEKAVREFKSECTKSGQPQQEPVLMSGPADSLTSSRLPVEQSPQEFLQSVRGRTCYAALRGLIAFNAGLGIFGVIIMTAIYILSFVRGNAIMGITGLLVGALGCFLIIACKQASLLLVDIADTLIEQNRKR